MTSRLPARIVRATRRWATSDGSQRVSPRSLALALLLICASLWAFGVLAEDVVTGDPIVRLDQQLANWLHDHGSSDLTSLLRAVTTLGSAWVLVPLALGSVAYLLARGSRRSAGLVALAIVGAEILTLGLKAGFERQRPFLADPLVSESSFSFPSGHATVSLALYGALAYLTSRRMGTVAGLSVLLGAALLVLLIGFSRLYLGVHFLSDVLAGFSAGLAWLVLCVLALAPTSPLLALDKPKPRRLFGVLTALLLVTATAGLLLALRDSSPAPVRAPQGEFVRSIGSDSALVWAVGDGANGSDPAKALASRIAATRPDRLLYLGDVYEDGTAAQFESNYDPVYGALADVTAPTPGNHDWPNHDEGYDPYWSRVIGRPTPAYYSFRIAGWQILSLNSEIAHEKGSDQERWLQSQARAPGTCRLAFWHRSRYSASTNHGDQEDMAPLWNALSGHASIALGGHDEDMQRLQAKDGITQFVSGAGGRRHDPIDPTDERVAFADGNEYGALRLELRPDAATYAFVAADGRKLDHGRIRCRRTAS